MHVRANVTSFGVHFTKLFVSFFFSVVVEPIHICFVEARTVEYLSAQQSRGMLLQDGLLPLFDYAGLVAWLLYMANRTVHL